MIPHRGKYTGFKRPDLGSERLDMGSYSTNKLVVLDGPTDGTSDRQIVSYRVACPQLTRLDIRVPKSDGWACRGSEKNAYREFMEEQ